MENKYFTRKINEGTVKRTHVCSFDSSIVLTMLVVGSHKVIDYLVKTRSQGGGEKVDEKTKSEIAAKESFISSISGLRVNGLPVIYEDLGHTFDDEEIMEVMAFVNDADMRIFGGGKSDSPPNV
jgi:hypothetical protein